MIDITKCKREDCSKKNKCLRYTAKPNPHRQSYSEFEGCNDESDYKYFLKKGGR